MNYGLSLSLSAEKHLAVLQSQGQARPSLNRSAGPRSSDNGISEEQRFGMQYRDHDGSDQGVMGDDDTSSSRAEDFENLEEKALQMAIDELYEASGRKFRPWAANGRACRVGEIILIVDSDTVVPEDCLRDAAREMAECPSVAIIQHESGKSSSCKLGRSGEQR